MAYDTAAVISTAVVLSLLGVLTICLRFWIRLRVRRSAVGLDDWLIVIAGMLVCGMGACYVSSAILGDSGRDYLTPGDPGYDDRVYTTTKISFAIVVIEKPTYGFLKLSVLLFFRRVFNANRSFAIANNILISLTILWTVAFFLAEIFSCGSHPSLFWKEPKSCKVDHSILLLCFGITDIVSDVAILALPYPVIRALHQSKKERVGIICIFALGWLSTAAGIIRMGYVAKATEINEQLRLRSEPPAIYSPPGFWTQVEVSVGIIAANLPSLAPLLRKIPQFAGISCATSRRRSSTTTLVNEISPEDFISKKQSLDKTDV